jgi:hypothetical protein
MAKHPGGTAFMAGCRGDLPLASTYTRLRTLPSLASDTRTTNFQRLLLQGLAAHPFGNLRFPIEAASASPKTSTVATESRGDPKHEMSF